VRDDTRGQPHGTAVAINRALQGIAQVAQQVPPICDLQGIGCAESSGFRVAA
jgi:hypothetical protein